MKNRSTAIAVDPGSLHTTAVVVAFDPAGPKLEPPWGIKPTVLLREVENQEFVNWLYEHAAELDAMFLEVPVSSYVASMSVEVPKMILWAGRMHEAFDVTSSDAGKDSPVIHVAPASAKAAATGRATANDTTVRHALWQAYGGKDVAQGKRCPQCKGKVSKQSSLLECQCVADPGWYPPRGPLHRYTGAHWMAALSCAFYALRPGGPYWPKDKEVVA